jgi:membrane-associated protease RseP (regulator of RpoE activity)
MIAFGGPVLGTVAAGATAIAGNTLDSQLLYALADWGYMINLFNLLPIGSMDGGRIGNAISPMIGVAGLVGGGAMIYYNAITNPIFYLIMLGGTYSTVSRFMGWSNFEGQSKNYYNLPPRKQASLFAAYLALIAMLLAAMNENNKNRKSPKQLKQEQSGAVVDIVDELKVDGVYDDFFADFFETVDQSDDGKKSKK